MKLQNMAVIFIIIILPISMVLADYTASRVDTLRLQISYDEKLDNATADAVEAFQMNTFNGDESVLANYKIENIEAAVNAFYTSVRTNFSMSGYNNQAIEQFIPAVVFILYDGYYIYSPYQNTWDQETIDITNNYEQSGEVATYEGDLYTNSSRETLFGLKPYIYYSCRYKRGNLDVVITYSLDNYVTIKGMNGNEIIDTKGYLLSGVDKNEAGNYTYNGVEITGEGTTYEVLNIAGGPETFACRKINGVKYYVDEDGSVFSFSNGVKQTAASVDAAQVRNNDNAVKYYEEAYDLKQVILNSPLKDLSTSDAQLVKNEDDSIVTGSEVFGNYKIFDELNNTDIGRDKFIEEEDSLFSSHRMDVIKYTVERNLSVAISNFNNVSTVTSVNFKMPELRNDEWDTVANNITMITFLQGLPIGSKVYNGYSIITNNKNKELVSEDSIYIITNADNTYHDIRDQDLYDGITYNITTDNAMGRYNMDFERETAIVGNNQEFSYYFPAFLTVEPGRQTPIALTGCYGSIVTRRNLKDGTVFDIVSSSNNNDLKKIYYTALGRERYGLYRVENNTNADDLARQDETP